MSRARVRASLFTVLCLSGTAANNLAWSQFSHAAWTPREPQNVVLILADDLGTDLVGAYESFYAGHPAPGYENRTPAIDYLASTGMTFRNCWSSPVCTPTRAQIMSGRVGRRNGIGRVTYSDDLSPGLDHSIPTIPTVLRRAPVAYATAAVGKWHLSTGDPGGTHMNEMVHALGSSAEPWFDTWGGNRVGVHPGGYNDWYKAWSSQPLPNFDPCNGAYPCEYQTTKYATVDTADDAILLAQSLPEPFFLYVAFNAPHAPLTPPLIPLTPAACAGIAGDPASVPASNQDEFGRQARDMVQWLDNEIGRLVCSLESASTAPENPVTIIFMGDNGTLGQAIHAPFNRQHGKGTLYEGGINVPLIVKSSYVRPDLAGSVSDVLVSASDLMATIACLGKTSLPPDPGGVLESVSIVPYLLGEQVSARQFVYSDEFGSNYVPDSQGNPSPTFVTHRHTQAIRNVDGYKLILRTNAATGTTVRCEELFDLAIDPFEAVDLITSTQPEVVQALASLRMELASRYPCLLQ